MIDSVIFQANLTYVNKYFGLLG
nr:unnamed protein product [Callosobruchus chinensis]